MTRIAKRGEMREFDAELGKRLAKVRARLKVRAKRLAAAAGVTAGAVYNYEAGRTSCPPFVLAAFARALGVAVEALMPGASGDCARRSGDRADGVRGR